MSKNWYPIINHVACIECGACVDMCTHGVYDKEKAPAPVVVNAEGCIEGCHGCGNLCPSGAISYFGDNTGWVAPNGEKTTTCTCECDCSEGCCDTNDDKEVVLNKRNIIIDFLFLDVTVCSRCQGADSVLDEAILELSNVFEATGVKVIVNKINVISEELAIQHKFISSPTIRVNGKDIQMDIKENLCESCGDLCGDEVDCRIWVYNGNEYSVPPKAMIIEAILKEVYGGNQQKQEEKEYILPSNLKKFYEAMKNKKV